MDRSISRRKSLQSLAVAGLAVIGGCQGDDTGTDQRTSESTTNTRTHSGGTSPTDDTESPTETRRSYLPLTLSGDWKQYRGNAANQSSAINTIASPDSGRVYWKQPATSASVLKSGRIFTEIGTGSANVALCSLRSETGEIIWKYEESGAYLSPAVGESVLSLSDALVSLDPDDAAVNWRVSSEGRLNAGPPCIKDGTVYLAGRRFGGSPAVVYAVNGANGETLWTHTLRGTVDSGVAVDSDHVYIGTDESELLAIERTTGDLAWSFPTKAGISTTPTVGTGHVYLVDDEGTISSVRTDSGSESWSLSTDSPSGGFAWTEEALFYSSQSGISRINHKDGTKMWTRSVGEAAPPAIGSKAAYVGTGAHDKTFYSLHKESGEILWRHEFPQIVEDDVVRGGVSLCPTIADGGILVTAADGLYAFGPE